MGSKRKFVLTKFVIEVFDDCPIDLENLRSQLTDACSMGGAAFDIHREIVILGGESAATWLKTHDYEPEMFGLTCHGDDQPDLRVNN